MRSEAGLAPELDKRHLKNRRPDASVRGGSRIFSVLQDSIRNRLPNGLSWQLRGPIWSGQFFYLIIGSPKLDISSLHFRRSSKNHVLTVARQNTAKILSKKRIFWKSTKRLFCNFLQRIGVWRPHYTYESCCLRSGLSIGGNDMVTWRFKHFYGRENTFFCDFVKSEGETAF